MRSMGVPWRRLLLLTISPALSALSPLLILPVIAHGLGLDGWGAIAVGQSVGLASALVVAWGWNIMGPSEIAAVAVEQRGEVYIQSVVGRLFIFLVVSVACALVVVATVDSQYTVAAVIMAVSLALSGLSPSWFYLGMREPFQLVMFDAVPRVLASIAAVPFVVMLRSDFAYPVLFGICMVVSIVASTADIRRRYGGGGWSSVAIASLCRRVVSHAPLAGSQLLATTYTTLSVTLVSIGTLNNLVIVAGFAAAFRLMNLFQAVFATLTRAFQGWVAEGWAESAARVFKIAMSTSLLLGSVISVGIALTLPSLTTVLFGGGITLGFGASTLLAGAFFAYCLTSTSALFLLIPAGRANRIALATVLASILGLAGILLLSPLWGISGACLAIFLAELTVLLVELPLVIRLLRTMFGKHRLVSSDGPSITVSPSAGP